jgi:hypothetical protein
MKKTEVTFDCTFSFIGTTKYPSLDMKGIYAKGSEVKQYTESVVTYRKETMIWSIDE